MKDILARELKEHNILAVERFKDSPRWMIEFVVLHERDRKGSVETTQEVKIYFNFIGRYLPPQFGDQGIPQL